MSLSTNDDFLIPLEPGQAVSRGWTAATGFRPLAVTWHWTATWDLAHCRRLLGGSAAERRGVASAHYGVGRSREEGVDRYVALENRSWHAGKNQTLRWDGRPLIGEELKDSRVAIGVETVNIGYARDGVTFEDDWIAADSPDGRQRLRVQPWSAEQLEMMVEVGREIVARFPHVGPRDHHGHHDVCPDYKLDVAGFPFARILREIYRDPAIPDVWTPLWQNQGRQRALAALGYGPALARAGGRWGPKSDAALRRLQREHALVVNGRWTVFVSWKIHELLAERGLELAGVAAG